VKYGLVQSKGKVIRCICILDHQVANTNDLPASQIILPQRQIGRKNGKYFFLIINLDIFIASLNHTHGVCKKGFTLAIISTMVETSKPVDELKPAFDLLGKIRETFITV
jgi:Rab GDP dissociation inhibitor